MGSVMYFNLNDERASAPSPLEKAYTKLYGKEFVDDLKQAYSWMKDDMKQQLPADEIRRRRIRSDHEIGDWISVFFVNFHDEEMYAQTIDDNGEKTIYNFGNSPRMDPEKECSIRYLLSGMYFYDKEKTKKWLKKFLGPNGKFLYDVA